MDQLRRAKRRHQLDALRGQVRSAVETAFLSENLRPLCLPDETAATRSREGLRKRGPTTVGKVAERKPAAGQRYEVASLTIGGQRPTTTPHAKAAVIATAGSFTEHASTAPVSRCGKSAEKDQTGACPRFHNGLTRSQLPRSSSIPSEPQDPSRLPIDRTINKQSSHLPPPPLLPLLPLPTP